MLRHSLFALLCTSSLNAGEFEAFVEQQLAPQLREKLLDAKFNDKAIGLLPFRAQLPKGISTFNAGTINTHFPEMLLMAMVRTERDPAAPSFDFLREVAATASEKELGKWYQKTDDRRQLFKIEYPSLWSKESRKPDVLLTGRIRISDDAKEASILIESFTESSPQLKKLLETKAPTSISLFRAMGCSFSLPEAAFKKPQKEREAIIVETVRKRGGDHGPAPTDISPNNVAGLRIDVLYNDERQKIQVRKGPRGDYEFFVATPKAKQKVTIRVTHLEQQKELLGFVLRVNGENTWNQERLEAEQCRRWLLKPGTNLLFRGFSFEDPLDGQTREQPWKVLSEADSIRRVADFGDKTGTIDLDVYGSGNDLDEIAIAIDRSLLKQAPTQGYANFRKTLEELAQSKSTARNRGVLVRDENMTAKAFKAETMEFNHPSLRAGITLHYYAPNAAAELDLAVTEK
jgi:hypothetical protein